ncbi:MAG TPA: protein kinase [Microbacteriaceae bacterium]
MRPTSGLTFGGRYQLSSRVAIGGMGEVWEATDLVIGRTVAIKILKDEYLGDPGFLERFRAEARHAALVNHEGIANVFDYGEEDGSAYLVMELVPGEALSTILERERVLSTDRVLDIVAQTAAALHAAHSAGLVHRDIKPGNLLITPDGRVKITDFGIARIADQVPLTATGQVMGTVQYLSPEQASGHSASPTTDIYSLGIVAYESLAGRRPFTGESQVAIAMAQINEAAPELPVTVSEPVRNLVYSSIAKNPANRPASAAHLARAAQALRRGDVAAAAAAVPGVVGTGSLAVLRSPADNDQATRLLTTASENQAPNGAAAATKTKRRNPWTWPLIALIALILIVVLAGILLSQQQRNSPIASPSATPTVTSASPTPSETPTPSPTVDKVNILKADFVGKTGDEARQILQGLGMVADVQEGTTAPTKDDEGRVYDVNPTGGLDKGQRVTVKVYAAIPEPASPPAPTVSAATPPVNPADGTYAPGSQMTVSWPAYSGCPSPTSLTAYRATINGQPSDANPIPPSTTSVTFTLPAEAGETTVTYLAECSGLKSPGSPELVITSAIPNP